MFAPRFFSLFIILLAIISDTRLSPVPQEAETTTTTPGAETTTTTPNNASESTTPSTIDGNSTTPTTNQSTVTENTTNSDGNATTASTSEKIERVELTLGEDETTPQNVFTNHFGEPVKANSIMNITLPDGRIMQVYTEQWETYYTVPPTKPGCMCLTRGPLSKFKLIGNLHFPKLKVTPPRQVTMTTDSPTTLCPPCICNCDGNGRDGKRPDDGHKDGRGLSTSLGTTTKTLLDYNDAAW